MFKVEIETDNAAFENGDLIPELISTLERVVQKISVNGLRTAAEAGAIVDTNGNSVGKWTFTR